MFQIAAELFEQQQFGTYGVEGVKIADSRINSRMSIFSVTIGKELKLPRCRRTVL